MSNTHELRGELLQQLQQRAGIEGISVDALLARLLETDTPPPQQNPYAYLDAAPSAVTIVDVSQKHQPTIYVNKAFEQKTGYSAEEIIGHNLNFLQGNDRAQAGRMMMRDAIQRGQSCTVLLRNYRKDGTLFWNEIRLAPLPDEHGQITRYIGIQNDVSERVKNEHALRDKENTLAMALHAAHAGVWVWDANSDIVTWDSGMEALHGIEPDTFGGRHADWLSFVHPDDRERVDEEVRVMLAEGSHITQEFRIIRADGALRHIQAQAIILRDETTAQPHRVIGINSDITQRKQAEQLKLDVESLKVSFQNEQAQNALIQRIISMLSHDLRTPLAVIASSRDLLDKYSDRMNAATRQDKLDAIGRQVQFAMEILQDTVSLVRGNLSKDDFHPAPVNLAMLCEVSVQEIQVAQRDNHTVRFVNRGDVDVVSVDKVLISRILINLLTNAIKYSPAECEIRLELDRHDDRVILRVIDQGMGISQEELPHIFDPFFRSDAVKDVHGTGLGLSIVKDCVERHHGRIHVQSVVGQGSTFTVELPLESDNSD